MRKLEQNGQMLRAQKQEKSSVFIYIKISTLLGLGWTSTFIAVIFPVFSYVFVFLTSFQGVYIFLAFVCNKNVLKLYKSLYSGQANSRQTICMRGSLSQSTTADRL
jgi:apolipoprotein N-acyltransferase